MKIQTLIARFFEALDRRADARERAERDAYLAQSTDVFDLELRIRRLDTAPADHRVAGCGA